MPNKDGTGPRGVDFRRGCGHRFGKCCENNQGVNQSTKEFLQEKREILKTRLENIEEQLENL